MTNVGDRTRVARTSNTAKKSNRYRISLGVLNADVVMAHEQIFGRVDPADDYRLRDSTWIDA
jgi:hypothetical protein